MIITVSHAHFLVFPGAGDISQLAGTYFSEARSYTGLTDALAYAASRPEYLLVSPDPSRFTIFSGPLNAPRQLARHLVAWSLGCGHLADWNAWLQRERSLAIAKRLRSFFTLETEC